MSTYHQRNDSEASSTRATTPTDSWESYFDTWSMEDREIPQYPPHPVPTIIEPVILDDELYHPENLLNAKFNLDSALDLDLNWDLNHHYRNLQAQCSPRAFGRLNDVNPASKRHAIFVSNRPSPAAARQTHQSRKDHRAAPVRKRPDDVDVRAVEMANTVTQPCVAPDWRTSEAETTRSHDMQIPREDHHQPYHSNTFWTASSAATATANQGRRVGQRKGQAGQRRQENRRAPNAASAVPGAGLGLDNPPVSCEDPSMISSCLPPVPLHS